MSCETGVNTVVLEPSYMLESPGEFLKFLVFRPHCESIKSESAGELGRRGGGGASAVLKSPQQVQCVTMDSDTSRFFQI